MHAEAVTLRPPEPARHSVAAMRGIGAAAVVSVVLVVPVVLSVGELHVGVLHVGVIYICGAVLGRLLIRCTSAASSQFGDRAT
jgi:hypothetical protein